MQSINYKGPCGTGAKSAKSDPVTHSDGECNSVQSVSSADEQDLQLLVTGGYRHYFKAYEQLKLYSQEAERKRKEGELKEKIIAVAGYGEQFRICC
jgi:hypothetical protein